MTVMTMSERKEMDAGTRLILERMPREKKFQLPATEGDKKITMKILKRTIERTGAGNGDEAGMLMKTVMMESGRGAETEGETEMQMHRMRITREEIEMGGGRRMANEGTFRLPATRGDTEMRMTLLMMMAEETDVGSGDDQGMQRKTAMRTGREKDVAREDRVIGRIEEGPGMQTALMRSL